jgi:hypothetical protein
MGWGDSVGCHCGRWRSCLGCETVSTGCEVWSGPAHLNNARKMGALVLESAVGLCIRGLTLEYCTVHKAPRSLDHAPVRTRRLVTIGAFVEYMRNRTERMRNRIMSGKDRSQETERGWLATASTRGPATSPPSAAFLLQPLLVRYPLGPPVSPVRSWSH